MKQLSRIAALLFSLTGGTFFVSNNIQPIPGLPPKLAQWWPVVALGGFVIHQATGICVTMFKQWADEDAKAEEEARLNSAKVISPKNP